MEEIFKEMIEQYIRENLKVELSIERGYGYSGQRAEVKILLNDEMISYDFASIDIE